MTLSGEFAAVNCLASALLARRNPQEVDHTNYMDMGMDMRTCRPTCKFSGTGTDPGTDTQSGECSVDTGADSTRLRLSYTGEVSVFVSHTPCVSCLGAFAQFRALFPAVRLQVGYRDWRDFQKLI